MEPEVLTLAHGSMAGRSFTVTLDACPDPLCPCGDLFITAQERPGTAPQATTRLCLDLWTRHPSQAGPSDPEARAWAEAFLSGITAEDWVWLEGWWLECKEAQLRRADLTTLKAAFPEELFTDRSRLVAYDEIVPNTGGLLFQHLGHPWTAADAYCLDPDCACATALLLFIPLDQRDPEQGGDIPKTLYAYHSGQLEHPEERPGYPGIGDLLPALRAAHASLDATLAERHRRLRTLFQAELRRRAAA